MNPQRLDRSDILQSDGTLDFSDVDRLKRYDCKRYDSCVRIAAKKGWPQFHCCACPAYEALPGDHHARRLFARTGDPLMDGDALAQPQPHRVEPTASLEPIRPIKPVAQEAAARERYERMCAMRRKGAATRSARLAAERERMREILLLQAETTLDRERINAILDGRLRPSAIERAQLQVLRERVRAERTQ